MRYRHNTIQFCVNIFYSSCYNFFYIYHVFPIISEKKKKRKRNKSLYFALNAVCLSLKQNNPFQKSKSFSKSCRFEVNSFKRLLSSLDIFTFPEGGEIDPDARNFTHGSFCTSCCRSLSVKSSLNVIAELRREIN